MSERLGTPDIMLRPFAWELASLVADLDVLGTQCAPVRTTPEGSVAALQRIERSQM